jgi:hypothetical protein
MSTPRRNRPTSTQVPARDTLAEISGTR